MDIQRVGVVGAGTMGNGIAHVFARGGYGVVLCDVEQRFVDRGAGDDRQESGARGGEGKITADEKLRRWAESRRSRIAAQLADCDFVIEAATEKFEIKTEIFRDLDRLTRPEVILASNTSSISITKLGAQTKRPEKVIGMHFFNPVPVMKLVEVIRGLATSQETFRDSEPGAKAGEDSGGGERRAGICLEPGADAAAERGHVRGDGRRGDGRGGG